MYSPLGMGVGRVRIVIVAELIGSIRLKPSPEDHMVLRSEENLCDVGDT